MCKSDQYVDKALVTRYSRYNGGVNAWLSTNEDTNPTSDTHPASSLGRAGLAQLLAQKVARVPGLDKQRGHSLRCIGPVSLFTQVSPWRHRWSWSWLSIWLTLSCLPRRKRRVIYKRGCQRRLHNKRGLMRGIWYRRDATLLCQSTWEPTWWLPGITGLLTHISPSQDTQWARDDGCWIQWPSGGCNIGYPLQMNWMQT